MHILITIISDGTERNIYYRHTLEVHHLPRLRPLRQVLQDWWTWASHARHRAPRWSCKSCRRCVSLYLFLTLLSVRAGNWRTIAILWQKIPEENDTILLGLRVYTKSHAPVRISGQLRQGQLLHWVKEDWWSIMTFTTTDDSKIPCDFVFTCNSASREWTTDYDS